MVRRYQRKKSARKATPWYNKKYSVGDIASKAWSGVKAIQAVINSETQELDTNFSGTTVANSAVITHLNPIAQGDGASNRTGNSSLMRNLFQQQVFYAGANTAVIARHILFIDKQQLADTAPSVGDLLESATPFSHRNKVTKERFQILEDRFIQLTASDKPMDLKRFTHHLDKHAIFNGTAGTDIQKNGIYSILITDVATAYACQFRLRFHDN